jgi:hypothetical protein
VNKNEKMKTVRNINFIIIKMIKMQYIIKGARQKNNFMQRLDKPLFTHGSGSGVERNGCSRAYDMMAGWAAVALRRGGWREQ